MDGWGVALALEGSYCLFVAFLKPILSELALTMSEQRQEHCETVGGCLADGWLVVARSVQDILVVFLDELVKGNDRRCLA